MLRNLQKTWLNYLQIPFSNIKKSIITNLEKNPAQFFAYKLFQILKKNIVKNLTKNMVQIFADTLFQILKKVHLTILKKTWPNFLLITFFKN